MNPITRTAIGATLLTLGLIAQAVLERSTVLVRPAPTASLSTIPLELGPWLGRDEPMDELILKETQADDYVNRVYEDPARPGCELRLWINFSKHGLNLRHSPEVCLPSGGWNKVEAQTLEVDVLRPGAVSQRISRLSYAQGDLVQHVGFWYYIFGEGALEHFVRRLPITSRSSHGRTTRGSGMTIEVFYPGGVDPDAEALRDFATRLLDALEPTLPEHRASYFIP